MLAGCGEGDQRADPEAVDSHLNQIIAREAAERDKLVAEARAREAVREQEMEEKTANYANSAD